ENGESLRCHRGDLQCLGQRAIITVRPERIHISGARKLENGRDALTATITDVTFLGDTFRLEMRVAAKGVLLAKVQNARHAGSYTVGQTVYVGWGEDEAIAFSPDSGK